ncbi:hypothetical protein QFW77_11420 [Luteimonas sp. RD2P54]|uniref:Uncharacterized protein n=1 Tax=Luteimonas endophytica TaxID=3042023 RepID=A0ABT6J9U9_9GAMM|nr:hypothetical protein [Luteimonas endophytica]MDH5823596.1 hypothetical protein [Luteimonas endophytica]
MALLAGCSEPEPVQDAGLDEAPPAAEREVAEPGDSADADDAAVGAVVIAPMPPPPAETDTNEIPVDVIMITPAPHLGQAVTGTVEVAEVPFDRGFWIEKNGQRMFAMIAQSPNMEDEVHVEAGQTLRLAGVVYSSELASDIAGEVEPGAMEAIAGQPAFLLVDARNISVIDAPER